MTAGERYNKVVDIWGKAGDEIGKKMMDHLKVEKDQTATGKEDAGVVQLHLHDGRLRGSRFSLRRSASWLACAA